MGISSAIVLALAAAPAIVYGSITTNQTYGEVAAQFVPQAIAHLDQSFEYFRKCGEKCLIPDDPTTINTRKETEYVRDQWDIFAYAYPPTPELDGGDPWPIFRELIEKLHKDIGDIKDLAGKKGKEKKLGRLRGQVMGSIWRYHTIATNSEWAKYFQSPDSVKMYHRTEAQMMSQLVWGSDVHYWFGPNTNRPVPTVRLSGMNNLAALLQLELFRLQQLFMNVMAADLHNITTLEELYEVKESIHDTRKETRIVSAQGKQFPELFVNATLGAQYEAEMHQFYSKVFTPVLENLRLWEKANIHEDTPAEEERTRKLFLDAVENMHKQQLSLPADERFEALLGRMRGNVLPVTVPEDPAWTGTDVVSPPPVQYWPLYLGVGLPIVLAIGLLVNYFQQRAAGFGQNSYQYLEEYGRRENLPSYGAA